jgi:hypothetical protein
MESRMPRRFHPIVSAVGVVFTSTLMVPSMNGRVFAGGDCIEQPNREPALGAHCYYHFDRAKNRKCWYLGTSATKMREAAPPQEPSDAVAAPSITSVFSSLFGGWPTVAPPAAPEDSTAGEPRIIQSNPTKPLRLEDIAQQQPDIPEERAEPRYATPLNAAQRRALFQEYLRWNEIQRNLGDRQAPARSP